MHVSSKQEGIIKDNLVKRNSVGSKNCAFCEMDESLEHLFIRCSFSKLIWQLVHFTFSITPPANIKNIFGKWLNGIDTKNDGSNSCMNLCFALGNLELSQ
jgi:hypothetical protein